MPIIDEKFERVPNFPIYLVSNYGRVINEESGYEFDLNVCRHGYPKVTLSKQGFKKTYYIHRLVAWLFLSDYKEGRQVKHKNGNKLDNSILNLYQSERKVRKPDRVRTNRVMMGLK